MVLPRRAKCTGTPPLQARIFVRHEDGNSVLMFRDESCCQSSFMFRRDASEELYKFTQDDVGRQRFIKEKGTTYISVGGAHFTLSFEELSDSGKCKNAWKRDIRVLSRISQLRGGGLT